MLVLPLCGFIPSRMPVPEVSPPTPWPCDNPVVGEVVECPGVSLDEKHLCKCLVQIRAGTNPDKPSFGKFFIMHPKDDGGCGYFSFVLIKDDDKKHIHLQEAVYRRAKRRMATSVVPTEDIVPPKETTPTAKDVAITDLMKMMQKFQEQLDKMKKNEEVSRKRKAEGEVSVEEEGEVPVEGDLEEGEVPNKEKTITSSRKSPPPFREDQGVLNFDTRKGYYVVPRDPSKQILKTIPAVPKPGLPERTKNASKILF